MKKVLLALLALGLLVAGGLAFHARQRAEDAYHRTVYAFAQHPDVRLLESDYRRGWQRSTASTSFEVVGATGRLVGERLRAAGVEGARHRVGFRLEHRIAHGPGPLLDWARAGAVGSPVVAVVDTTATFDQESQTDLRHAWGEPPALRVHAVLRGSGVGEATLRMPSRPLTARPDEDGRPWQGVFDGLQGDVVFTTDGLSLAGSVESPGVEGGTSERAFAARGVGLAFDLTRADVSAPWSGRTELSVARLEAGPERPALESLHVVEERQGGVQDAVRAFEVALGRLVTPEGGTLGPGRLELVVRGAAADALVAAVPEDGAAVEGAPGAGDAALPARAFAALPRIAAPGAGVELRRLELATPEGAVEARGHVRGAPVPPRLHATPLALLAAVDLRLELRAPEALLDASDAVALRDAVAELRERGLIRLDEGVLETQLQLSGGVLRVHGEVVPLEPLLGVPVAGLATPGGAPAGTSGVQGR